MEQATVVSLAAAAQRNEPRQ
uniref:Uncharacterized protein n=1 Tax=Arundo donax TaxID=35708 RepID=A0A0A9HBH1_ARUDO